MSDKVFYGRIILVALIITLAICIPAVILSSCGPTPAPGFVSDVLQPLGKVPPGATLESGTFMSRVHDAKYDNVCYISFTGDIYCLPKE